MLFYSRSIALRFVKDQFDDFRESTIGGTCTHLCSGVPHANREARRRCHGQTRDLVRACTDPRDTAGQERYKSLAPMYYRNAHCAIVVYDITEEDSLENAKAWIRELQRHADANITIALVGNKLDLEDRRAVPTEDGAKYAESEGLMFLETSAKTPTNIDKLFKDVANKLPLDRGMGAAKRPTPGAAQQQPAGNAPVQLSSTQQPAREDACTC